jgi:hypothetical protein
LTATKHGLHRKDCAGTRQVQTLCSMYVRKIGEGIEKLVETYNNLSFLSLPSGSVLPAAADCLVRSLSGAWVQLPSCSYSL